MRRWFIVTSAWFAFALTPSGAQPANTEIYAALARVDDIAGRMDSVYCPADEMRAFDGALDGINAARGGAPPLVMRSRDFEGFAGAFDEALASGADIRATERAAIDGMVRAFDPSNLFFSAADVPQTPEDEQVRPAVTWRVTNGAAILAIPSFSETSGEDVRAALRGVQNGASRSSGIILDLRDNQGGLLDQILAIADHFVDSGAVAIIQPFGACGDDEAQTYNARRDDLTNSARLIVLVNEATASGAELLAATLRERRGATLVGQTTHGNASLHTLIPVHGGAEFLKLRTGTLTTASGATWDQTGLAPDVETAPGDPTLQRALALLATR